MHLCPRNPKTNTAYEERYKNMCDNAFCTCGFAGL
jgi:hypothetical protein